MTRGSRNLQCNTPHLGVVVDTLIRGLDNTIIKLDTAECRRRTHHPHNHQHRVDTQVYLVPLTCKCRLVAELVSIIKVSISDDSDDSSIALPDPTYVFSLV